MSGNLVPAGEGITLDDLILAIQMTHGMENLPPGVQQDTLLELVSITAKANKEHGRTMGYGATLAWGVALGIFAERIRKVRVDGD